MELLLSAAGAPPVRRPAAPRRRDTAGAHGAPHAADAVGTAAAVGAVDATAAIGAAPSAWVRRFAPLIVPGGTVLDVACGSGRHLRWLAAQGFAVTGVDRDAAALAPLADLAEVVVADLEAGPWPLGGRRFDAVVVTNYLWRPLWPALRAALADGGVLLHETFADGHQRFGRPSRPDFLLARGELLRACAGLRIVAFEDGFEAVGPRCVQRVAALCTTAGDGTAALVAPERCRLDAPVAVDGAPPGSPGAVAARAAGP